MIKEITYKDKAEWLSLRGNYIGGSDAGAVVGLNPYKSAYALWAEKTGQTPPFNGTVITEVDASRQCYRFFCQRICNLCVDRHAYSRIQGQTRENDKEEQRKRSAHNVPP